MHLPPRNEVLGLPAGHSCDSGKPTRVGGKTGRQCCHLPATPRPAPAALLGAVGSTRALGLIGPHPLRGNRVTSGGLHRPIAHSPPQRFMADVDLGPDPGPDPGPRGRRGSGRLLLFTQSVASLQGAVALGWALPANAPSSPLAGDSDYFGSWNTRSIHSLIRFSKQTFSVKTKSGGGGGA